MKTSNLEEPKDLRNKRKSAGRPSTEDRSSLTRRKELAKDVIYLALTEMKKNIQGASVMELSNIIRTCTPIVQDDDKQMDEDVTFDVLLKKYYDVSVRIRGSIETPETITEETD